MGLIRWRLVLCCWAETPKGGPPAAPALGQRAEGRALTVDTDEAAVVARIVELHQAGRSLRDCRHPHRRRPHDEARPHQLATRHNQPDHQPSHHLNRPRAAPTWRSAAVSWAGTEWCLPVIRHPDLDPTTRHYMAIELGSDRSAGTVVSGRRLPSVGEAAFPTLLHR